LKPYLCAMSGIYIHIPFCKKACTYCDFHFSTTFEKYRTQLIDAICLEIKTRQTYVPSKQINTIYFGGGTPSLLNNEELSKILNQIHTVFTVNSSAEITLEANPDDINEQKLNEWQSHGINRLSIGVQSFRESDLRWMNRAHKIEDAHNALRSAKNKGFELSLDLMYGIPNLSKSEWIKNIESALDYHPEHISAYCLTVEENTALYKQVKTGKVALSTNEEEAEQFSILQHTLIKYGYEHYEISNFAKNQKYAKHNSNYWLGQPYLGLGPSAHSYNVNSRSWNIKNNSRYIQKINNNESVTETEVLSQTDIFNESLLIGLRTKWGVNLTQLQEELVIRSEFQAQLNNILSENKAYISENHLILTNEGKAYADAIAAQLFIID
jgi:oxygen-independent coproporphyrinogen III oxidase